MLENEPPSLFTEQEFSHLRSNRRGNDELAETPPNARFGCVVELLGEVVVERCRKIPVWHWRSACEGGKPDYGRPSSCLTQETRGVFLGRENLECLLVAHGKRCRVDFEDFPIDTSSAKLGHRSQSGAIEALVVLVRR